MREFDHSLAIAAPPARILDAFFNAEDLASWWNVARSLGRSRGGRNSHVHEFFERELSDITALRERKGRCAQQKSGE